MEDNQDDNLNELLAMLGADRPEATMELDWNFEGQTSKVPKTELLKRMETSPMFKILAKHEFRIGLRKETLNTLIPELPPPGTDLYIISNGSGKALTRGQNKGVYDFAAFIPYLADMISPDPIDLLISTWSMNKDAALCIAKMIDDGRLSSLTIASNLYFNQREPQIANFLVNKMDGDKYRYVSFKNHSKIICVGSEKDNRYATITGSSNIASQPRIEQFNLSTSPDVYHFYKDNLFDWAIRELEKQHHDK